jgi:hypothetical protein
LINRTAGALGAGVHRILDNFYIGITTSKKGSYYENQGRAKRRKTGTVPGLAANAQHASLRISGVGAFFYDKMIAPVLLTGNIFEYLNHLTFMRLEFKPIMEKSHERVRIYIRHNIKRW